MAEQNEIIAMVEARAACGSSNAQKVYDFTRESSGKTCPLTPRLMNREEAMFIARMVCSEMIELLETVFDSPQEAQEALVTAVQTTDVHIVANATVANATGNEDEEEKEIRNIANQADSMVDAWYYMLNAAAKKGVNLSRVFDVVHGANMAKRFPDGKFHRREDGKVIKPPNWQEPDIVGEIKRQRAEGAFIIERN